MNFSEIKKYLDLRKYVSLNMSSIAGLFYYCLYYKYIHTKFPPYILSGEGLVPSDEESLLITKLSILKFIILLLTALFIIEIFLKPLFGFLWNKCFNIKAKEKILKSKLKYFLFLEITYSILFIIGNTPLFLVILFTVLFPFGIEIRPFF